MTDFFALQMTSNKIGEISSLGLAHMGDAVYELMVRAYLCESGKRTARHLHRETVRMVSARAQARAAQAILGVLTKEESDVFRRGRNAKVSSIPPRVTPATYHQATGLEALFGWLYLNGRRERLGELFELVAAVFEDDDPEEG